VVVLTHAFGRGKASGAEIRERRANLFRLRGGKVTKLVVYWNRERALADLGLAS
jgi:ketosteroid isomerase-like protein